ncbi:hypothetical protein A2625_07595 [candidate division WOR-1 bacterium RIFCSPHIGHO2_01_FULL_53_15]|uniref:Phospholipid/glycerol acyltransferase domain-containing protein n=1 Tax=candidate division WOR-1 bacterium RIFCSPHIGHO2_01_FULL_53_15 TaxID=1802564 RepID=A0A1F4Q4X4_UNCSA|nr:MAG: hypothetical protein A2625_07595 [candidate division WOR-1 bacterium RIFCSPHIGHO2_01_FULL_53_15]OGC10563.1 MAG: hypothetical protein A3D23_01570 [candidate division WOR-1 bacterium RIFCSPHIGHO2_02_FULL_53_26]
MELILWAFLPFLPAFIVFPFYKNVMKSGRTALSIWQQAILLIYQINLYLLFVEGFFFVLIPVLIAGLFAPNKRSFFHAQGSFWAKIFLRAIGVKVSVEGEENIPPGPAIYVQDVRSYLDGAATLAYLPFAFRFVFQRHLFGVTFFGWLERLAGYLALEPDALDLMHDDVVRILKTLGRKENIVAFAEQGNVHGGVALFSIHSKLPVVTIRIKHDLSSPPVSAFLARPLPVSIRLSIGQPITSGKYSGDKTSLQMLSQDISRGLNPTK